MTDGQCESQKRETDILVVSAGVGVGHNHAAKALMATIGQYRPDIRLRWLDVLATAAAPFRMYHSLGHAMALRYMPFFYGLGYRITDTRRGPDRSLLERRRLFTQRLCMRRYLSLVDRLRPPVILHTHCLAPPLVGRLPEKLRGDISQVVAVTGHHFHRYWYSENIDRYFVASPQGIDRLVDCGMDAADIHYGGIPIHPRWREPMDVLMLRNQWNIKPDCPVVVVSGGVDFAIGDISGLVHDLLAAGPDDLRVIVLAGANKRLLASLSASHYAGSDGRLMVMAFTDRNHELAALSDLVITRPGAMTTAECLSVGRPMVLLSPLPGPEAATARYMQETGAALTGDSTADVVAMALRLLKQPSALAKMSQAAFAAAGKSSASETIARYVCDLVDARQ